MKTKTVGKVEMAKLATVRPNPWNPNEMDDATRASLAYGLEHDGWLASQALLVWRTDDVGADQMVIIDGEHRWTEAQKVGFKDGPMVFLDGLSAVDAKALTIKLNQKRGAWNQDKLGDLLRDLAKDTPDGLLAVDLGIADDALAKLLADAAAAGEISGGVDFPPPPPPIDVTDIAPTKNDPSIRLMQLYLDAGQYALV